MFGRDEKGNVQTLEVVIIASIMVSAVTFVATFETAPPGSAPTRDLLAQQAQDALSILYDTPVSGSNFGDNLLSVSIAECLNHECDNLTRKLSKLLPSGASYAIYMTNGYGTFPVYVTREPGGEAVTATQMVEPKWSNSFVATAIDRVDPDQESLLVYSLPIFHSNVLTGGGSPLTVLVHGTRVRDGSDYTLTSFATTQAYDATDASKIPAVSFHFSDGDGDPMAVADVSHLTVDDFGPTNASVPFRITMTETAGVPIKAGVNLTFHAPRGWTAVANQSLNSADWRVLANATDAGGNETGGVIRAELLHNVSSSAVEYHFEATYHGDDLDYYPFIAQLSRGALSSASLVVRADTYDDGKYETPLVQLSVPRPMGATATTTWTLGATVPETDGLIQNALYIDRIEIIEQDGANIFGGVANGPYSPGEWSAQSDRLVWTGQTKITHGTPLNLSFSVTASGTAGAAGNQTPFVPPITFDSGTGKLVTKSGPGLYRQAFPPASTQYGHRTGYNEAGGATHNVSSQAVYRSTQLPGSTTYKSGMPNLMQDSIFGSYVSVDRRTVPVGSTAVFTTDVQSVLFALAEAGQKAGVNVNVYPPWSGDDRIAKWTNKSLDKGIFGSSVTQIELLDLNADGIPDPIVGTTNGRVFALHGLTGARLPNDVYTVPLGDGGNASGVTSVTHLRVIDLEGTKYIVLGTDDKGYGLIVLDLDFNPVWTYPLDGRNVLAMDISADITGDGRKDIVLTAALEQGSAVFVLEALPGSSALQPYSPGTSLMERVSKVSFTGDINLNNVNTEGMFFFTAGESTSLLTLPTVGPDHTLPGLVTTMSSTTSVTPVVYLDAQHPDQSQLSPVFSLPRAGLQGVDQAGEPTYTFFGSPVTSLARFDYDGDSHQDILAGGSAGYVFMMNGSLPTQPLYSLVLFGAQSIVDSVTLSPVESYALTDDGQVIYTDDAWTSTFCLYCDQLTGLPLYMPTAKSISVNATGSLWLLTSNEIYQTVYGGPEEASFSYGAPTYMRASIRMNNPLPSLKDPQGGSSAISGWVAGVQDFTDVHFLTGADADLGWVIGNKCITCTESLVMRTTNGGTDWFVSGHDAPVDKLVGADGGLVTANLNRVYFDDERVGWIAGDDGTLLRSMDGGNWTGLTVGTGEDLLDISCLPETAGTCVVVGRNGTAYRSVNAHADAGVVVWDAITSGGALANRELLTVGFQNEMNGYIGAKNAILRTYDGGSSWTTLPLNYVVNDATRVDVLPNGMGYIYGGNSTNARIWFVGDFGGTNTAQTVSLTDGIPSDANITRVELMRSNFTGSDGTTGITAWAATTGEDWKSMGNFLNPASAGRNWTLSPRIWNPASSGSDFRLKFDLWTAGDKTLYTPLLREAEFIVSWQNAENPNGKTLVTLDFSTQNQYNASASTAWWDTEARALHQPVIQEYWVRNVSGDVRDIQTGYNVTGDTREDVWIATASVFAENSPDHALYVQDKSTIVDTDDRVYLLDGANGTVVAQTEKLDGSVTQLRVSDHDGDGVADFIFAVATNTATQNATLYILDPLTLAVLQTLDLTGAATDLEAGLTYGDEPAALVATAQTLGGSDSMGFVWSVNATSGAVGWKAIPDDRGRYVVSVPVEMTWLFGPYVIEVEVTWETLDGQGGVLINAARFYDYFQVTPPGSLSPPSPIYDVHLVAWFDDWG